MVEEKPDPEPELEVEKEEKEAVEKEPEKQETEPEPEPEGKPEPEEPEKADDDFEEQKKIWEEKLAKREAALAAKEQELQTKGLSMSFSVTSVVEFCGRESTGSRL